MKERMEGDAAEGPGGGGGGGGEGTTEQQEGQQQQQVVNAVEEPLEDINGNPALLDTKQQTSKSGPRLISITRTDQGFGFTLRHFIVYPPELSELLGDHVSVNEPVSCLDPLDTIFVKHVRQNSPAHLAGLNTGDRVVSVNGESVGTKSYQEVVSAIHRSPPTLQLLVVPREQDLLQQVFGETAHNPESNLDIRMPSPSHPQQLIRYPGPYPQFGLTSQYPPSLSSAWSSQSSLASHPSAMSTGTHTTPVIMAHPPYHPRAPSKTQPHGAHIPIHPNHPNHHGNTVPYRSGGSGGRKHSLPNAGDKQSVQGRKQSLPADKRQAINTIQSTLSSVPHKVPSDKQNKPVSTNSGNVANVSASEQMPASVFGVYEPILDRAVGRGSFKDNRRLERDPNGGVHEVVQAKVVETKINSGDVKNIVNQGGHVGRKISSNEIDAKRVRVQSLSPPRLKFDQHSRSSSVHTRPDNIAQGNNGGSQNSINSTKSEVLIRSTNKPNSYSRRSYTDPITSNMENCNDKPTQDVINRIMRNTKDKEEYLNRPNQPILFPASKPPLIRSDYHVNPQKLPGPMWPPPQVQTPPSPSALSKTLTFIAPKSEKGQQSTITQDAVNGENEKLEGNNDSDNSSASNSHRSLVGNSVPKPYVGTAATEVNPAARYGKSFQSTLSRIQENIPIPEYGSSSSLASRQSDTPPSSEKSSVLRPIPLAWVGDNERIKQLQIVSKRAKQFENSQLEKEASAKSAFHRFELTRLSQRSKIPNVAQRKQEFEKRDSDQFASSFDFEFGTQYSNAPRQRKSAELVRCNLKEISPSPRKVFRSLSDGGTVFPVSRTLYSHGYDDESASPSSTGESDGTIRMGMNRMIPVGGPNIHCKPPSHFVTSSRPQSDSDMLDRERSNSVCSQASMNSVWSTKSMDDSGTHKPKYVARQNSYLSALTSPVPHGELSKQHSDPEPSTPTSSTTTMTQPPYPPETPPPITASRPKRPTFLPIKNHARPADKTPGGKEPGRILSHDAIITRTQGQKTPAAAVPYASSLSRLPISMYQLPAVVTPSAVSPGILSSVDDTTPTPTTTTTTNTLVPRRNKAVYGGDDCERLVRRVSYIKATSGNRVYPDSDSDIDDRRGVIDVIEGEGDNSLTTPVTPAGPLSVSELPSPASLQSAILRQGLLHVKLTMVDGKRAGDRSWKTVWAVVQGRALIFYKDRQHALQTPLGVEEQISLRGAEVEVASDYTKRRNVLRLATPGGSQLLLQADTPPEMLSWLSTLHNNCAIQEGESESNGATKNNNVSPQAGNKAIRKLATLRTRSPTSQSPSTKARKPGAAESNVSPKSKSWKGHLKFMRKGHSGSPAATPTHPLPDGATIGVCLEDCPQSLENGYVPLLVALCVGVVETRGLQTQGIYRIPGNTAAVKHLTEMINKDPKSIDYDDPKWNDVNVISSVLKQFFQKLPDPLFTCDHYPSFIKASKIEDSTSRMVELKKLVHELPDHHYETLRYLILHLSNIVANCNNNKMDVRNLAIVFGPTLVRAGDDDMYRMVTDMSYQCRIIESLISHASWFFNEEEGDELSPPLPDPSLSQSPTTDALPLSTESETPSSQDLLLHNIEKVEGNAKGDMKRDIMSSIISAANRKVHKVKYRKPLEEKPIDESKFSDKEGGFEERDIDKEAELRKQRVFTKHMESMVELPDPKPMSERKISNMSLMSVQSQQSGVSNVPQTHSNERTSGLSEQIKLVGVTDDNRLLDRKEELNDCVALSSSSNSTQPSSQLNPEVGSLFGDEVAIRSYAGLSASTQERIRRFKMETLAMLQRDVTRHRREVERRDVERQRLEEMWRRAKQDMESDDILDQLADNPTEVVRKISDYPWRLQDLNEGVGGDRGSVASSTGSHLISAALSHHHPLSNTPLTPTTNAISQVSNSHLQPPIIKVPNDPAAPTVGKAYDSNNDNRHGMLQQNSLAWLDYNATSPHNTLGSTCSSASSGYGSLTRSSHANNPVYNDDLAGRSVDEAYSTESCRPRPFSVSQQSSPSNSKKKKSSKSGFLFGLASSSSSPSLFPSMTDSVAELTPTRKIGQTTIYPESPRPPPHRTHPSSQTLHPPILVPKNTAPTTQGRHKDSILHHILPSRLYHSPRPLRRGSSAESVTEHPISTTTTTTTTTPLSPSIFDSQKVVYNGTLRRARGSRDQIINGPEGGVPRCGSLDSLRDSPHVAHDDGSDLLSAITATLEEKMMSLQDSPLGLVVSGGNTCPNSPTTQDPPLPTEPSHHSRGSSSSSCRLYRDPSLHRRRTNPRSPNNTDLQGDEKKLSKKENDKKNEDGKREVKVKRSDSLTKSEKTENNLKEKTEKRARELKRTDTQDSLSEKKPKEMKRSDLPGGTERSQEPSKKLDSKDSSVNPVRRTSDLRGRRHNFKELKEKFEQNTTNQTGPSAMKPSNGVYGGGSSKANKMGMRRNHRGPIKRRHTVGGTKDLAKWAWVNSGEGGRSQSRATRITAWEQLQPLVVDERLNTDRSLDAWLTHERIRTSSPDLSRPQHLVLPYHTDDKENLHRRLSVLESHV